MKKISTIVSSLLLTLSLAGAVIFTATPTYALDGGAVGGANSARTPDQPTNLFGTSGIFNRLTTTMLYIIGAVAVIMIVIGGLRYVISGGDNKSVEAAKNTILYAVIGIIVALLAYAVVSFVIGAITSTGGGSGTGGSSVI